MPALNARIHLSSMHRHLDMASSPREQAFPDCGPLSSAGSASTAEPREQSACSAGLLIVNADDWGRDQETTQRIFDCVQRGTVSSVSAMVFMSDSERAAEIASESRVDAGLHFNFTTPFSASGCPAPLAEHQRKVAAYLLRHRAAKTIFHPGLVRSFEYVVAAQMDEFRRIYRTSAARVDGHHHMHLCANVLLGKLLPANTIARRNFSFQSGEKSLANRLYRNLVDRMLSSRHQLTDFFFSLPPLEPEERLHRIFALAHCYVVEVETHPVNPEEYRFLMGQRVFTSIGDLPIATSFALPHHEATCAQPA